LTPIDTAKRLAAREAENDVGKEIEAENEYSRNSTKNVIDANFARLQESLRSIEEFSKINHAEISRQIEQLRYQSYILHKEFLTYNIRNEIYNDEIISNTEQINNSQRHELIKLIGNAKLYVLIDCMEDEATFKNTVKEIIDGGINVIQLRDKSANDQTILSRSNIVRDLINNEARQVLFIMNDRTDLTKLAKADGVHVGQDDLSVSMARQIVGDEYLVGVSTHNITQARQAVTDGSDYIGAGAVFTSATKNFESLAGIEFLKEIQAEINIPAFAIGGINENNISEVLATGFSKIAVSKAILNSTNPKFTTEKLRSFL
jgi:thiamine-phosphate pyrophosphorylase